jgi:E3 ubiquitin-protein ligase DOA10
MESEKECRVCRDIGDASHPLYAPCLCNGSILYCHQDCLEEWLKRSNKTKCELCGVKYKFSPKYSPDMPKTIPLKDLIRGGILSIYRKVLPVCLRVIISLVSWLCLVPLATTGMYAAFAVASNFSQTPRIFFYILATFTYSDLFHYIASGILLTGLIVLTFIVLVRIPPSPLRSFFGNVTIDFIWRFFEKLLDTSRE